MKILQLLFLLFTKRNLSHIIPIGKGQNSMFNSKSDKNSRLRHPRRRPPLPVELRFIDWVRKDRTFYVFLNAALLMIIVLLAMKLVGRLFSSDVEVKNLIQDWFSPILALVSPLLVAIFTGLFLDKKDEKWQKALAIWRKFSIAALLTFSAVFLNIGNAHVNDICFGIVKADESVTNAVLFAHFQEENPTADYLNSWPIQFQNEMADKLMQESVHIITLPNEVLVQSQDDAFKLMSCTGANLTIWGTTYSDKLEINYTASSAFGGQYVNSYLRSTSFPEQVNSDVGVVSEETFSFFVTSGGDFQYALNYALGMSVFLENPHQASLYFSEALSSIDESRMVALNAYWLFWAKSILGPISLEQIRVDTSRAIELNPNFVEAYELRGLSYQLSGDNNLALEDYNQALVISPENPGIYLSRGITYQSLGDFELAFADYEAAIELYTGSGSSEEIYLSLVFAVRGSLYIETNQNVQAMADFNHAVELDPSNAHARNYRAKAYTRFGNFDLAVADYTATINLIPLVSKKDQIEAYLNRGALYDMSEHFDLAIDDFNQAVQIDPTNPAIYVNRGQSYFKSDEISLALTDYSTAIQLSNSVEISIIAYFHRGYAYAQIGQTELAITDFSQVLTFNPNMSEALVRRGFAYLNLGLLELALTDLEQYVTLSENPEPDVLHLIDEIHTQLGH